jgi:hypothetical protein
MKRTSILLAGILATSGLALGGCEEGYPHNEQGTTHDDMVKTGEGTYGGTNSTYDTGNSVSNSATTGSTTNGTTGMGAPATGTGAASGSNSTTAPNVGGGQ